METAQLLEVLSGFEAIARVEQAICPDAVVRNPAVAEGLALSGLRAASLADGIPTGPTGGINLPGVSCVHHVSSVPGRERGGVFEFVASSLQQAIDHCLAAHVLSRGLGRPGLCSLAPALSADLSLVRLPGAQLLASVLEAGADGGESDLEPGRILELAREALNAVAERTGRPSDLLDYEGEARASLVLVGSGGSAAAAQEAARALSLAGVPAAALSLNLVRPFPESRVREALVDASTVLVVEEPLRRGTLLERVRSAANEKARVESLRPSAPGSLLEGAARYLPDGVCDSLSKPTEAGLPSCQLAVAPAGAWGEATVRQVVGALGYLGPLRMGRRLRRELGATVLAWGGEALPSGGGDLLLASHPMLLDPEGALGLAPAGGTVVVLSTAESSHELARLLGPEARSVVRDRELRVHWLAPPEVDGGETPEDVDFAASLVLAGASLAALGLHASGIETAETVAAHLEAADRRVWARWLREGAAQLRSLDPADLDPSRHIEELDFRRSSNLLRMPAPAEDPNALERWTERIRRFHWTGKGISSPTPGLCLWPVSLVGLEEALRGESQHPFVLAPSDDPERGFTVRGLQRVLGDGAEVLRKTEGAGRTLLDNLPRLASIAARIRSREETDMELASLMRQAGAGLVGELHLVRDEELALVDNLEALCRVLPGDAKVLDLGENTPLRLYLEVQEAVRGPLIRRFFKEMEGLQEQLRELLLLDRQGSGEGRDSDALAAALGGSAVEYIDPDALSKILPRSRVSEALDPARRQRIEAALSTIGQHLERRNELAQVICLRPPDVEISAPGLDAQEHADPLAAAVGVFDGTARKLATLFRAIRVGRLEAAGNYRPELHEGILAGLDWEAFTAAELALVPAVVVVTSGQRLRQRDQASLSELLCSSRPVHVIVKDEVGSGDEAEDLSRFRIDLGYLVMAHREALCVASSLARPSRLAEGLALMARALRPAVAIVHLPHPEPAASRSLRAEAALQGRACPDFRYDPDAGPSWADRFDLEGNPQPERSWPRQAMACLRDGAEETQEVALTFVDAVALEPTYQRHLRVVPPEAWGEAQLPLAEYLQRIDPEGRGGWIPYVWVVGEHRTLQRAVVTRELALACRDRQRGWRLLQELAGHGNVLVERAAAAARDQALAEAASQRAELERAHAEELERVETEVARESIERVAALLLNADAMPVAPTRAALPLDTGPRVLTDEVPAAPVEVSAAVAEPALEEPEGLAFEEPYIDAPLCTSCNDCTDINPRLFQYNADKQAFIADPAAGTFEELVKAAEKCPARCIHPGKPRSDDPTATPGLIERAAPFN
jgi:ferredoxin